MNYEIRTVFFPFRSAPAKKFFLSRTTHLDNDFACRSAASAIAMQLEGKYVIRDVPLPHGKDWNDYLQHLQRQKHSRQMGRE